MAIRQTGANQQERETDRHMRMRRGSNNPPYTDAKNKKQDLQPNGDTRRRKYDDMYNALAVQPRQLGCQLVANQSSDTTSRGRRRENQ